MSRQNAAWRLLAAATLVGGLAAAGCQPVTSGGGTNTTDAVNVNAQYTYAGSPGTQCQGSFAWSYQPVTLTGISGRTSPVSETKQYNVPADASGQCVIADGQLGLKKGTWRIQNTLAGCTVTLTAPTTLVTFRQGAAGCTTVP
jgi:hypothetical protein